MSIRAYKIIKIDTGKGPTFNVSENFHWLQSRSKYKTYNDDGKCREMEFFKEHIEEALLEEQDTNKLIILNKISKDMGNGFSVDYSCY